MGGEESCQVPLIIPIFHLATGSEWCRKGEGAYTKFNQDTFLRDRDRDHSGGGEARGVRPRPRPRTRSYTKSSKGCSRMMLKPVLISHCSWAKIPGAQCGGRVSALSKR